MNTNRLHALAIAAQMDDARRGEVGLIWDRRDSKILDALFLELEALDLKPAGGADPGGCYAELTRVIPRAAHELMQVGPVVAKGRSDDQDPSNLYPFGRALIRACLEHCEAADTLTLPEISDRCRGSSVRLASTLWNQLGSAGDDGTSIFKIRYRTIALPNGPTDYRDRCLENFAQVIEGGRMAGVLEGMRLMLEAIAGAFDDAANDPDRKEVDSLIDVLDMFEAALVTKGGADGEA